MTEDYEPCPNDARLTEEIDYASSLENDRSESSESSLEGANNFEFDVKSDEEFEIEESIADMEVVEPTIFTSDEMDSLNKEQEDLWKDVSLNDLGSDPNLDNI